MPCICKHLDHEVKLKGPQFEKFTLLKCNKKETKSENKISPPLLPYATLMCPLA